MTADHSSLPSPCHCGEQITQALRDIIRLAHQPPPPLLTIDQAAERLNVPRATLAVWVSRGKVSHTRVAGGKHVRFTEEHIADIIAAGEHRVATPEDGVEAVLELGARRFARRSRRAIEADEVEAARQATAAHYTRRGWR